MKAVAVGQNRSMRNFIFWCVCVLVMTCAGTIFLLQKHFATSFLEKYLEGLNQTNLRCCYKSFLGSYS